MGSSQSNTIQQYKQQIVDTEIIIDSAKNKNLQLNELLIFPHGLDGLHIWEAGIILAKFIVENEEIFENKTVLELGSGIGIGGLAACKFTNSKNVMMTDYNNLVLENIQQNIQKNLKDKRQLENCKLLYLDWNKYEHFDKTFDIIIASDVIYSSTPFTQLSQLLKRAINKGGFAYIIIPSQRYCKDKFLQCMDELQCFNVKCEELNGQIFKQSPLKDEALGFKIYSGLKELTFSVYIFEKIK